MSNLSAVWHQVEALLSQKISIIPVREKDEESNGKSFIAKTPYGGWRKYQSEIISKDDLWQQMEKNNTSAIAIICGKVSGNLEVIDIDVKYEPGIDAILFNLLNTLYPDLFGKLRIHKTPSGGYHLLYRIDGRHPEQNQKLAGRPSTDEELEINPKSKTKNFLETRGEGGYIVAPPSLNYSVHQFVDIPIISWEERCSIIELCKSLTRITKVVKEKNTNVFQDSIYDENPFVHFNSSPEAEQVLIDNGWDFYTSAGDYIYFTRPGKKTGTSATFNKSHRLYYFFTSSTDFEESTWYNPSTVLAKLLFNDDKKKLYSYLVSKGYGKLKPKQEQQLARKAAQYGTSLPENISSEAKSIYEAALTEYQDKYPHGIFWSIDDKGFIEISREKLYRVSEGLGFHINEQNTNEICLIDGYIVKKVSERYYFDAIKQYVKEEDAEQYESIINTYESFLQKSGSFTISRLPLLSPERFLLSDKKTSYKFYANCYLEINADEIIIRDYSEINMLIWEEQIHQRQFSIVSPEQAVKSLYVKYLHHAVGLSKHLKQCIGYLSHEFKDEEMGYIIVLTEQCPDPKHGGGSGKNIFSSLLKYITTFKNIPGTQVQYNEKFLQAWNFERVFSISDVPKKFDFTFLKELSTGSGILKKLFKDEVSISPHQMPKLIVSTNFSYDVSDGGLKRRIIPIEFTDFFTKCGGVNTYFNAMFPADWDGEEWLCYDNFICSCIQDYLANNGKLTPPLLTAGGKLKQFDMNFGQLTREFIEENFISWVSKKNVRIEEFNNSYLNFCNENGINIKYRLSSQLMNKALEDWCEWKNIEFHKSMLVSENNIKHKCKVFGKPDEDETVPF